MLLKSKVVEPKTICLSYPVIMRSTLVPAHIVLFTGERSGFVIASNSPSRLGGLVTLASSDSTSWEVFTGTVELSNK